MQRLNSITYAFLAGGLSDTHHDSFGFRDPVFGVFILLTNGSQPNLFDYTCLVHYPGG
jgi:hypothetical protein